MSHCMVNYCLNYSLCTHIYLYKMNHTRRRYQREPSSQLTTPKSIVFPINNSNLQSSCPFANITSVSNTQCNRKFWNFLSSHLRFSVSLNLLSSQRLIISLPVTPGYTPTQSMSKQSNAWPGNIAIIIMHKLQAFMLLNSSE